MDYSIRAVENSFVIVTSDQEQKNINISMCVRSSCVSMYATKHRIARLNSS